MVILFIPLFLFYHCIHIFASVLNEFPITSICVKLPSWLQALPYDNKYISEVVAEVSNATKDLNKIGSDTNLVMFENSENFETSFTKTINVHLFKHYFLFL